jgi:hypothetical protein
VGVSYLCYLKVVTNRKIYNFILFSDFMVFASTNECVQAIVAGLDLHPKDRVLSICGAGDAVFAISEYSNKVIGVDSDLDQIRYAQKRKKHLINKEFEDLLKIDSFYVGGRKIQMHSTPQFVRSRNDYFNKARCEKISSRLEKEVDVSLLFGDIFDFDILSNSINKIYLSNSLTYLGVNLPQINFKLKHLATNLPKGGLIYVSDYKRMALFNNYKSDFLNETNLILDKNLSEEARKFQFADNYKFNGTKEGWTPAVFKKD